MSEPSPTRRTRYNSTWIRSPGFSTSRGEPRRNSGPSATLWFFGLLAVMMIFVRSPAFAGEPASPWVDTESASVRLISAVDATGIAASTAGQSPTPLTMGLEFQLAEHWKIYWRSPGDAGYPPRADWAASENVTSVQMAWPAPVRFSILGFETLGYADEVVFPLSVMPKVAGEAVRLAGTIDYLICSDICVPATISLAMDIPAGEARPSVFSHLINKYSVTVPGDGKSHGLSIDRLSLDVTDPARPALMVSASSLLGLPFGRPDVYLEGPDGLGYGQPETTLGKDGFTATLRVPVIPAAGLNGGLVDIPEDTPFVVTLVDGERSAERAVTTTSGLNVDQLPATDAAAAADGVFTAAFMAILGIAFLGGLILNLMPCVLPVLSIKLLGVVSHGGSEARTVRLSFFASAAGIIVSFLIIGGTLSVLKSAGATIGWGIQFQQPWFLVSMMLVVAVFACNLWGWFEVHLPAPVADAGLQVSHAHGMGGHFLTGMLATLLATPCSAPFLGTAVGFALARDTSEILIVFATLGLGLATPYILVALMPVLATTLPRPGRWMVSLRRVLGIALAGTAGWLLWVISQQVDWLAAGISGSFTIGIALVFYLRHIRQGRTGRVYLNAAGLGFAIIALAVPILAGMPGLRTAFGNDGLSQGTSSPALDALWRPFDRQRIPQLVADGFVVFVDVTADWCISCKVNKSFVLAESPVIEQLESERVVAMQADWTLPDAAISDYLASFSRYGIPFNAVYGPGAPAGIMLPELLTTDVVMQALRSAAGE